ncbi:MAG TPA: SLBB domain-containing protein [Chitinophagales bacterium]|nr:SLBB domain-containing protein [Chitinophagales bacterium]
MSRVALVVLWLFIGVSARSQDTTVIINQATQTPTKPVYSSEQAQSWILQNQDKLQLMGISPSQAQAMINQYYAQQAASTVGQMPSDTFYTPIFSSVDSLKVDTAMQQDTVRRFKRYGLDLFQNRNIQVFNRSTDLMAPDNYIIGTGDKISISVWGYSSYSAAFTIDETGSIFPPQSGKIYLRGLTLGEARKLIRSRFSSSFDFRNNDLEVTILNARSITVNVVGEVFQPGSFTFPAFNTAFNALIAAGGVTERGSLRTIFIKRAGKTVKTFDVYAFLQNPTTLDDFYLQDNDYVFVPSVGKVVEITGAVQRPMEYELKEDENLNDLVSLAGGLASTAYTSSWTLKRNSNQGVTFLEIPYDRSVEAKQNVELKSGDVLTVPSIPTQMVNHIVVNGPLTLTGDQSFRPGEKLDDLLKRNPPLIETAMDRAFVTRRMPDFTSVNFPFVPENIVRDTNATDNIALENGDVINFFSKAAFTETNQISVSGAVRAPGNYAFAQQMTLGQLLFFSGGLKPDANADRIEISRIMETQSNGSTQSVPVIVKVVKVDPTDPLLGPDASFVLEPNDLVNVRTKPIFDDQLSMLVRGEVNFPGLYTLTDKNERLSSIVSRAGGLTQWAYAENALLYREESKKGPVAMRLDKVMKKPGSRFDVIIKKGDELVVPLQSNIVSIGGQVKYPFSDSTLLVNVPYEKGKRAKHYVKKYGLGFNVFAKRNRTYVVNPGHNLERTRDYGVFKIYPKVKPGATVVVPSIPYKEQRFAQKKEPIDWNRAIENFTIKATGVATLLVILWRVSEM